jgi:hypothetical protein
MAHLGRIDEAGNQYSPSVCASPIFTLLSRCSLRNLSLAASSTLVDAPERKTKAQPLARHSRSLPVASRLSGAMSKDRKALLADRRTSLTLIKNWLLEKEINGFGHLHKRAWSNQLINEAEFLVAWPGSAG